MKARLLILVVACGLSAAIEACDFIRVSRENGKIVYRLDGKPVELNDSLRRYYLEVKERGVSVNIFADPALIPSELTELSSFIRSTGISIVSVSFVPGQPPAPELPVELRDEYFRVLDSERKVVATKSVTALTSHEPKTFVWK